MKLTRSLHADIALAVALAVVGIFGTVGAGLNSDADRSVDVVALGLAVATALTLVVRRRWPLTTLCAATVFTSAYLLVGYPYGPILVSFFVAVYTVARHVALATALTASLAALALLLTHLLTNDAALPGLIGVVPASAWVVVPFAVGVAVRSTRESATRARAEAIRERVDDERLRVAQEVHDVVGHGLAAIKMQADVALHLMPTSPDQAGVALHAISRTSAEALDELRATLAVVRRRDPDTAANPRSPAARLDRLEDLRQRMGKAGLRVRLEIDGQPRPLPDAVHLAGYRIAQESLTNVLRHSDASTATMRLGYDTDLVTLVISNPASSVASSNEGLGISGMRERVAELSGDFAAGPVAGGRFEVRASLPTGAHT